MTLPLLCRFSKPPEVSPLARARAWDGVEGCDWTRGGTEDWRGEKQLPFFEFFGCPFKPQLCVCVYVRVKNAG